MCIYIPHISPSSHGGLQFLLKGNEINLIQITNLQRLSTNQMKSNVGFWWEGKTGVPGGKPLIAELRTNKLNPRITPSAEIEPGPHWWKASALTTWPTLPPNSEDCTLDNVTGKWKFALQWWWGWKLIIDCCDLILRGYRFKTVEALNFTGFLTQLLKLSS